MSDIPEEIMDKINDKYPLHLLPLSDKDAAENMFSELQREGAIFGYHLMDKEVKELKENEQINLNALTNAVDTNYELTEQLQQKDIRIKKLENKLKHNAYD